MIVVGPVVLIFQHVVLVVGPVVGLILAVVPILNRKETFVHRGDKFLIPLLLTKEVRDKVNNELNLPFRISQDTGVIIIKVVEDASASEAGLKPGDIIMRINGTKISNSAEVKQLVQSSLLAENLNFEIERDGNNMSFTVNPGCCVKPETSP